MEITITQKGSAKSDIGGFKVAYNWEFSEGVPPTTVQVRATKEDSETVIDCSYYHGARNLQFTVHYISPDFDMAILADIFEDIKSIIG